MSNLSNGLDKFFNYVPMKEMAKYLNTYNIATQQIAIDGVNTENIQSTGDGGIVINGNFYACAEDEELDISEDTEGTETAWATATSYSAGDIRKNGAENIRYRCILAHTSSTDNEPGNGMRSYLYWEEAPHNAVNASGAVVTTLYERWVLITAKSDGVLTMWLAGDEATIASGAAQLKVPQFDPLTYCPVAIAKIAKDDAGNLTIGTTALTGDITFYQLTGPIFPHKDNMIAN